MFHVAYRLHASLLVLLVPTWVLHPLNSSVALVPKVCLLCPCSCCACLVNPHISLYHVGIIAFVHVVFRVFHIDWLMGLLIVGLVDCLLDCFID